MQVRIGVQIPPSSSSFFFTPLVLISLFIVVVVYILHDLVSLIPFLSLIMLNVLYFVVI